MRIKRYVSKNSVNTCPPISEYKIINASKFSAVMMPFRNYFPQLGNQSPNLNNLGPTLLQIPWIPQSLEPNLRTYALIGNITVRENCRWADQVTLHSKISPKSWPLAIKSPAQSLDYHANSYHIHLNTLGFHGCGKEISQICPCPFCPINTSFSGTRSPSCHSTARNPLSWWRHCLRTPRTSARVSSPNPPSLRSSSLWRNGHQLRRSSGQSTILLPFALLLYSYSSAIPFTEYPFFLFVLSSSKLFRIWPIRS